MKNPTKKVSASSTTRFNTAHENMLYNILSFALSAENIAITQSIPAFYTLLISIQAGLTSVQNLRQITRSPITGYAANKKKLRDELTLYSINLMNAGYSFAIQTDNHLLRDQMKNPASRLGRVGNLKMCQIVSGAIQNLTPFANDGSLAVYNITPAAITQWSALLGNLKNEMSSPQNAIAIRQTTNLNIYNQLRQCMVTLTNNCDTLISQFRSTNPTYYNTYWANRRLNNHHLSTQLRATITDQTSNPITTGEVFIIGTDKSAPISTDGHAFINQIPFGKYQLTITTPTITQTFGPYIFKKGKSLTLHLQIETVAPSSAVITTTK